MANDDHSATHAYGLGMQYFAQYIALEPVPFQLNGAPSGAVGAIARLSVAIDNFPEFVLGVRINNVYPLPPNPNEITMALYRNLKEHTDGEQTVLYRVSQQSVTTNLPLQMHITGRPDGQHWHSFPVPYPIAGANNIQLEIQRITPYPLSWPSSDPVTPILPVCYITLVCGQGRSGDATIPPHRIMPAAYPGR